MMKIVRNTKNFFRFKYRKGHNIHSPFVYHLVRAVFLPTTSSELVVDKMMRDSFMTKNVKCRHATRWCQLAQYLKLKSYVVDAEAYNDEDLVVVTSIHSSKYINSIFENMHKADKRVVLVVNGINKNRESREWWSNVSDEVILDFNYFGVVIFDKHLNTKRYKLKF